MFGGLEIKDASKNADNNQTSEAVPAAKKTTSSFAFMNVSATEQPQASPAPAVSSFSFLNSTSSVPAEVPSNTSPEAAPSTASGFSFMVQDVASVANETPNDSAAAASSSSTTTATTTVLSGFDFIASSSTTEVSSTEVSGADAVVEEKIQTIAEERPAQSGFSFLSGNNNSTPLAPADGSINPASSTASHTRANSSSSNYSAISASPSTAKTFDLETTTSVPGLPTGAGVTFGTSAKRNVVKKKIRSAKIGVASNQTDSNVEPSSITASPPAVIAPPVATPAANEKSSHEAALEATKRAEAFMESKALEATKSEVNKETVRESISNQSTSSELRSSTSTDDDVLVAEAAAKEAKILQQQQKGGGFMGTFFKGFRTSPNTTTTMSTGSLGSGSNHTNGSDAGISSGIDRLPKEHKVMKDDMAERPLPQQSRKLSSDTADKNDHKNDKNANVIISVNGRKKEHVNYSANDTGSSEIGRAHV